MVCVLIISLSIFNIYVRIIPQVMQFGILEPSYDEYFGFKNQNNPTVKVKAVLSIENI